jgi:hypothetical protein
MTEGCVFFGLACKLETNTAIDCKQSAGRLHVAQARATTPPMIVASGTLKVSVLSRDQQTIDASDAKERGARPPLCFARGFAKSANLLRR